MADFSNAYASWRLEWLSATRAAWRAAFRGPPLTAGQVTFEWCGRALDSAYAALSFVLHQTPKFVVTDAATCAADDSATTVGLTNWACTKSARLVTNPDAFVHSATFETKPPRAERESMWRLASRVDNDWIVVPLVALFLRLAMEDPKAELAPADRTADAKALAVFETEVDLAEAVEQLQCMADHSGAHIGLVEFDTPQLPTLQFAGKDGGAPAFLSMTRHDRMNALRVGSQMMDPVHGRPLAGKRRLGLLDVELSAFLVWNWYREQGLQEDFDQVVAAYAQDFAAAAQRTAGDTRDIDDLVASIHGAGFAK
jgi:hypothetical protein